MNVNADQHDNKCQRSGIVLDAGHRTSAVFRKPAKA